MDRVDDDRFTKVFNLRSGFTIGVKPLPPYYMDVIKLAFPLLDMPKREVVLLAGDRYRYEYDMPDEPLDESHEDYDLYMKSIYVQEQNEAIKEKRRVAKRDLLLSNCVTILDGPESVEEEQWVQEVEAFAPEEYRVPEHEGARRLLFIKMRVLTDTNEAANVQRAALYEEVSEQGISSALQGFRNQMEGRESS